MLSIKLLQYVARLTVIDPHAFCISTPASSNASLHQSIASLIASEVSSHVFSSAVITKLIPLKASYRKPKVEIVAFNPPTR